MMEVKARRFNFRPWTAALLCLAALFCYGAAPAPPPLDHPDAAVREAALTAITERGLPGVAILTEALTHADPKVRGLAAMGLVRLGPLLADAAITALCEALADADQRVAHTAAAALARGGRATVAPLFTRLGDPRAPVRERAAALLHPWSWIYPDKAYPRWVAAATEVSHKPLPEILLHLMDSEAVAVRKAAVRMFKLFPEHAPAAAPRLIAELSGRQTNPEVAEDRYYFSYCVELLTSMRPLPNEARPALMALIETEAPAPPPEEGALSDVMEVEAGPGWKERLLDTARRGFGRRRTAAMQARIKAALEPAPPHETAEIEALAALSHESRHRRRDALLELRELRPLGCAALSPVTRFVESTPVAREQARAAHLLEGMGCPTAKLQGLLLQWLEDTAGQRPLRLAAADLLGKTASPEKAVISALEAGLGAPDPALKAACAGALWRQGRLGNAQLLALLTRGLAAADTQYGVREVIVSLGEAFARLPGAVPLLVACLDEDVPTAITAQAAALLRQVQG